MATPTHILTPSQRYTFDSIPKLSKSEGIGFTAMDAETRKATRNMRSDVNKVGFVVQKAYFQAKGRFFNPAKFKPIHIKMATRALGLKKAVDISTYNPKTASQHRSIILKMYNWKPYKPSDRKRLEEHALLLADKKKEGKAILHSLFCYCWANKIEIPGYAELAQIVNYSFIEFEKSMKECIAKNITKEQKTALLAFIDNPEIISQFQAIKRINQSTSTLKLNYNADLLNLFQETFFTVEPLLDKLDLSIEALKYFSEQVHKLKIRQIRNIKDVNKRCLLLVAFVQDQLFLRDDYAVDALTKTMRSVANQGKKHNRSLKEKDEKELQEANKSVLNSAKNSKHILKLIIDISKDTEISLFEKNEKILHLAESYFEAENPGLMDYIGRLETSLNNYDLNTHFYQFLSGKSQSLQRAYLPLIRLLTFDEENSNIALIDAINFIKEDNVDFTETSPIEFLSRKEKEILLSENATPTISQYKVILLYSMAKAIRQRKLTLKYSYRYKANHTYMISEEHWSKRKEEFIRGAGLEKYTNGKEHLTTLGQALTKKYADTNERFINGENVPLSVTDEGIWNLKASQPDFDASKYIPELLSEAKPVSLYELLSEIDGYTKFTDSFSHHSTKNSAKNIKKKLIFSTLMSLGTNLGHTILARASRGIQEGQLRDTERNWFTQDSLEKANKCIVDLIQSLPLPTIYNDSGNIMHSSSDGKKVVVAVNSLLANYSYKYYGKEQGVTVTSFLDNKQSFFHVNVMTSSDREAPYMMDGLVKSAAFLGKESEIENLNDPDDIENKHSTDTHGYTEAIFAGLHFLDVSFAPRIAKLNKQTIYAFEAKSLRKNTKKPIAPNTAINKKLILDNWDDILRLMATIKLHYCPASLLFRILSASAADSPLYAALKELGRLLKSTFILNYIDDEELRVSITKQLNRVELGQKLGRAVFYGRSGSLHVGTVEDMQRVVICKTILQNAIILWNYLYLSDYYNTLTTDEERRAVAEMINKGSVISWKHINMMGIFDFDHDTPQSFKSSIKEMMDIRVLDWEDEGSKNQ